MYKLNRYMGAVFYRKEDMNMTRDRKILYSVSASLFVILLLLLTLPISGSRYIAAILLPLAAVAVPFLIKKRPIYSIFKKQVLMIMALSGVLYVIVYYLTGLNFKVARRRSYHGFQIYPDYRINNRFNRNHKSGPRRAEEQICFGILLSFLRGCRGHSARR